MDTREVWVNVFIAALPANGIERSARYANEACDEFDKRFPPAPSDPVTVSHKPGTPVPAKAEAKVDPPKAETKV